MKTEILPIVLFLLTGWASEMNAQHVTYADDGLQRGYYDRPWLRYEAEPGRCGGNAEFLLPVEPYTQQPLQAEASNLIAANLVGKGDRVEWTCDKAGDGLTIRFSLPDSDDGKGMKGMVGLYVDGAKVQDIELDSYWAWQYTLIENVSLKYPDNIPSDKKFARMRFDEKYVLLDRAIPAGTTFALVKEDDNTIPYTIDFVELEAVPAVVAFESIADPAKVKYEGTGADLQTVINSNPGKTIYIPEGTYTIPRRLVIGSDDVKLIGAGMWHTTLYFSASSDNRGTYSARGIQSGCSRIRIEGMSLNTVNNKRYYNNDDSKQVGKGFMGSFGTGSVIRDVRVDHFECGAWIADYDGTPSSGLLVQHCRFRNNYADGINLCSGSVNGIVEHCSFRNNGDDDMASWSTGKWTENNVFRYNTAENNWRASSLGFFGGRGNRAENIVVIDAMEAGVRVNGDFPGTGFASDSRIVLKDISIYNSGCRQGVSGTQGGFWGARSGALHVSGGPHYDVANLQVENIDIYDARFNGVELQCLGGKSITGLFMRNVTVHRAGEWGVFYDYTVKGDGHYENIRCEGITEPSVSDIPSGFDFRPLSSGIDDVVDDGHVVAVEYYDINGVRLKAAPSCGLFLQKDILKNGVEHVFKAIKMN